MNRIRESLLTIGEAAALLDVPRWKLAYWVERGTVSGPSIVVPGRRLFSMNDVERIRDEIALHAPHVGNSQGKRGC